MSDYEPETVLMSLPAWNSMANRNHELQERIAELEAQLEIEIEFTRKLCVENKTLREQVKWVPVSDKPVKAEHIAWYQPASNSGHKSNALRERIVVERFKPSSSRLTTHYQVLIPPPMESGQ